jgi:hypothetical protein
MFDILVEEKPLIIHLELLYLEGDYTDISLKEFSELGLTELLII